MIVGNARGELVADLRGYYKLVALQKAWTRELDLP